MLKRVIRITNQAGETKYEIDFQNKFGEKINKAMEHLETCVDLKNPTRYTLSALKKYEIQWSMQTRNTNTAAHLFLCLCIPKSFTTIDPNTKSASFIAPTGKLEIVDKTSQKVPLLRCWSKFEELHHELQDYIKSNLMHSLHDISPRLAQLTRLSTPLPGTHQDYR